MEPVKLRGFSHDFLFFAHHGLVFMAGMRRVAQPPPYDDPAFIDYLTSHRGNCDRGVRYYVSAGLAALGDSTALADILVLAPAGAPTSTLRGRWAAANLNDLVPLPLEYNTLENAEQAIEWIRQHQSDLVMDTRIGKYVLTDPS